MFGKRKLAIGLAGVVAMTTIVGAGVASAHGGGLGGEYGGSIRERAAEILGIDPTALGDALQTAREEAAREKLEERLAAAVENETITQAEMDEVLAWVDAKPDVLDEIGHRGPHFGLLPLHSQGIEARLSALVEAGTITQDQADKVAAWIESAPDAVSEIAPDRRGFGRGGFGWHGHRGRGPVFHLMPAFESTESGSTSGASYSGDAA